MHHLSRISLKILTTPPRIKAQALHRPFVRRLARENGPAGPTSRQTGNITSPPLPQNKLSSPLYRFGAKMQVFGDAYANLSRMVYGWRNFGGGRQTKSETFVSPINRQIAIKYNWSAVV